MSLREHEQPPVIAPSEARNNEVDAANYRFTVARLLLESAKDELRNNASYTRALTDRYFTNVGGVANDISRPTIFDHGGVRYRVGYAFQPDDLGGWRETLEIVRCVGEDEARLVIEAAQRLPEASSAAFDFDGRLLYLKLGTPESEDTDTPTDAYGAARTLISGLSGASVQPTQA